jgi:hypothetical protein
MHRLKPILDKEAHLSRLRPYRQCLLRVELNNSTMLCFLVVVELNNRTSCVVAGVCVFCSLKLGEQKIIYF